jgi:hypothetical protein
VRLHAHARQAHEVQRRLGTHRAKLSVDHGAELAALFGKEA